MEDRMSSVCRSSVETIYLWLSLLLSMTAATKSMVEGSNPSRTNTECADSTPTKSIERTCISTIEGANLYTLRKMSPRGGALKEFLGGDVPLGTWIP